MSSFMSFSGKGIDKERMEFISERIMVQAYVRDAVVKAMEDGWDHGYRGNWKGQSAPLHLSHAFCHLERALARGISGPEARTDIEHAICRLAMALIQWQ